ncbi:MAG: hypothetical protein OWS74_00560 [Firmicutes bacterium]|nr:hypothetical protein [Bacillota bacterium]
MSRLQKDTLTGEWIGLSDARQRRPLSAGSGHACPFCPGPHSEVGERSEPVLLILMDKFTPIRLSRRGYKKRCSAGFMRNA